ncbi:MAG: hybrid sensor histidine kinase/response regulator [Thermodesulfobacteriota bacterium]
MKKSNKDIYILLGFLLFTIGFLYVFDPINTVHETFELNSSYEFDKILVFLLIFCFGISLYALRRWREVFDEAAEIRRVEEQQRELKNRLESKVEERTSDLKEAFEQLNKRNKDLEIINKVTNSVNNSVDVDNVCNTVLDLITSLDYIEMSCIYMIDETGQNAELKFHKNLPPEYVKNASMVKFPGGLTWKVINSGEMLNIENISKEENLGTAGKVLGDISSLGLPISIEGDICGVIWISGNKNVRFNEREVTLLTAVTGQLSIALTRAKVYKDLYKKNRYETIINSVSRVVHGSINLDEVLQNAVEAISVNVVKAQRVSIYLIEGEQAVLKAQKGYGEEFLKKVKVLPYKEGITWKAIIDKEPIYCPDAENDVNFNIKKRELGINSYVAMPIKLGEHLIVGTININSLSKNAFDEEELKLLEIVSSQIENAINNAKYAEALRKSEELLWQKISQLSTKSKYESIVRSITDSIHKSIDLLEILESAAAAIKKNIDCIEHVAIHIIEGEVAVLKAHRGMKDSYIKRISRISSPQGLVWQTINKAGTVYCPDVDKNRVEEEMLEINVKSYLSIPLFEHDKVDNVVGTLSVSSFEENALSKDDIDVLEMVSQQIETAIDNAKKAEVLSNSEERYRTLFEQSPLGVYIFDNQMRITHCNDRMAELMKSPKEKIIGLDMKELKDKQFLNVMKRALGGEICQHEGLYEATTSNNSLWLSLSVSPLWDKDKKVIGAMSLVEDRTDLVNAGAEVTKAQRLESLGVLAGGIAHDFNNILTAVLGSISLAKYQANGNKDLNGILTDAEAASNRAKDLTQQLLTFARGGEPVTKLFDIGKVVNESSAFALTGSNIKLNFVKPDDIWFVKADEGQIIQVFNNLVINAQQAMPDGGFIEIKFQNVNDPHPSLPKGRFVKISVIDQGLGIPKEHISKIFDPYFTTKQKGTGLGLSTSHSIIEKHGGLLNVKSIIGKGSTFNVFLPASCDQIVEVGADDEKLIYGKGSVLVMDDEKVVRETTGAMLKKLGYKVDFSTDGEEALKSYKDAIKSKQPYDVVILDLTIPGGMGGKQAIEKMRGIDPEIRAIVSSGYSNSPVMADYKNFGFSGILPKPYTLKQLGKVLNEVIQT